MRLPDRFRTISFRLSVGYGLLFGLSAVAIMAVTYVAASTQMQSIVRASISEDLALFRHGFREGGEGGLVQEVRERIDSAADDRFFLLLGPDGQRIVGNLPASAWAPGPSAARLDPVTPDATEVARGDTLYTEGITLGDYRVLAARRSDILEMIRSILLSAILTGCMVTVALALVGGVVVGLGPSRRVDAIAATTRRIVEGRLDLRLPVSGRGDELDRLATDINVMLARIETLVESLRQVSTDIAHDLRTPLARLRQGLEGIGRTRDRAGLERAVDAAVTETDAIIETFNALLRIAQIDAGARKARFRPVDLSDLADRVADAYGEVAIDAGHRLLTRIDPGRTVQGDADLLTQLLANLVENAITHVPAPGRVTLTVRGETDEIVLEVADDGPGVPPAEREKIFRRLYRLDRSRSTPGHGLGLALVASIAELHGARIEVRDAAPGLVMRIVFSDASTEARPEPAWLAIGTA
ncbi:HAMP domain-containing sensor histidine kinase [uncultured Aureimonas sp.]|uniref:sensor histidine kinase n=1 Tax=uncultured Aureimonas sp. TaxID=1604662 RepID=UPI0025E325CC|nr:HAMP domain-containing sensor histidine kinase [uncultured Aureimonas sp.]